MNTPKNDGGPAFPFSYLTGTDSIGNENWNVSHGMSLRDHFAGEALSVIIGRLSHPLTDAELLYQAEHVASHAYKYADAMIAERSK